MTRIKLCGLRDTDDARAAVEVGADLVGIVVVSGAHRMVPRPTAAAMVTAVREHARSLGRFAPEVVAVAGEVSIEHLRQLLLAIQPDAVQLVGDEVQARRLADGIADFDLLTVLRTVGVAAGCDVEEVRACVNSWHERGAQVVYDAAAPAGDVHGGTGQRIDPALVAQLPHLERCGLAGGLDSDCVADVVRTLAPAFVDVSSGIEVDGAKDRTRMAAFVAAVRAAQLDELPSPDHVRRTP